MIVKEMARRLSQATGQTEELHAGQIRHWARNGLFMFEIPERSGGEANSRFYFNDRHLAAARLFALFAAMGWNIDQLREVSRKIKNIASNDAPRIEHDGFCEIERNGLKVVVDAAKAGDFGWCFGVYINEAGTVCGGNMLRDPASGYTDLLHGRAPVFTAIALGPLFRPLFAPSGNGEV